MLLNRLLSCFALLLAGNLVAQTSPFIQVDQFGYLTEGNKVAVLVSPEVGYNAALDFAPSAQLELRNATSDAVVFSAAPQVWNNGLTHSQSGDKGWWFDFSAFEQEGSYYVYDPDSDQRSGDFDISANPYEEVLNAALRMFYYNRCNFTKEVPYADPRWTDGMNFLNPLQDANCRPIFDPNNAALEKDLSGGWFDAGDYNKYVTFAHNPVHELLSSFEINPALFGDDWNWPESGNGLPDILDEVKWELDWVMKMTNSDGTAHIKMGAQNFSENAASPPSSNTEQRFYGPVCTSASAASASMLARAAHVYQGLPNTSGITLLWEQRAAACFDHWFGAFSAGNLETNCDNGEIVAGDADRNEYEQLIEAFVAAVYLLAETGDSNYAAFIEDQYTQLEPINTTFWSPYTMPLNEALLYYTTLPSANSTVASEILSTAQSAVQFDSNGFFQFEDSDLYRAQSPDWIYHWGSSTPKAGIANMAMLMRQFDVFPSANDALYEKAYEQMHYFHGVNPQGKVQLSNMYDFGAENSMNEIYHGWFADGTVYDHAIDSPNGPAPGFVVGGVNQFFSVATISPPAGQPIQKSYLDFNDGWPNNSWELSEPAIYYQAAYFRMLAQFVSEPLVMQGCLGDLNGDGLRNTGDVVTLIGNFGCTSNCLGDLNGNGSTDVSDLLLLLSVLGEDC